MISMQKMNVISKISCYFKHSVVTLKLRKEYLDIVTYNISVLLRIKYWTVWYIERYPMSTYVGVTNCQNTVRFFGPPCRFNDGLKHSIAVHMTLPDWWWPNVMFYSGPVVVWLIVFDPSVCLSVCPRACLWNRWTIFAKFVMQIPCGCGSVFLWSAAICYDFRFYGWRHVWP